MQLLNKVRTFPDYTRVKAKDLAGKTTVVIDVLRATSTITAALANGAKAVIPVEKIKDGLALRGRLKRDGIACVCGGERDGVKLNGYNLGNSPLEYTEKMVAGKLVVLCTTNGTQAINRAAHSGVVLIGCLNNAAAVAQEAADAQEEIVLLCAGTRQRFSCDDLIAAGAIIDRIARCDGGEMELDDLSNVALYLYRKNRNDLRSFLAFARPCRTLTRLGMERDIDNCLREDVTRMVPVYREDIIESRRT